MNSNDIESLFEDLLGGSSLPEHPTEWIKTIATESARAPKRAVPLNGDEKRLAVSNTLRYVPQRFHSQLAPEFANELKNYGHIYAFRFMPNFRLQAPSLDKIPAKSRQASAIILMILNNLDPAVAQFPAELVTYGGNGQVFSNWLQFRLVLRYLAEMSEEQTLVLYSGHPLGLFPSHRNAPRVVITNGMMIPNYSSRALYDKYFALGVTMYGQMTAGSYCYIGPQGIVHGTTITVMNAGRKYLGVNSLAGKVFVSSGLGGMSGAQAKAAVICGCIGVIAEINERALLKRHEQGWLDVYSDKLDRIIDLIKEHRQKKMAISIGYLGNIVDLWERLVAEKELLVELGSDQTSLHNPFNGGYYPVGLSFDEANILMAEDNATFTETVKKSLLRHIEAIRQLKARGMHFWDYGNAFLVECYRAGAQWLLAPNATDDKSFVIPSYMQDIMGDIFSLGFGPFRWLAMFSTNCSITEPIPEISSAKLPPISDATRQQYRDNQIWIQKADDHKLVVGSKARILYSDQIGRVAIALEFNRAVREEKLKGPVVISRDHHDVSGTDSPFRETANIQDGSAFTADMAVQNAIGDSFRGATWVSLHNGGGVGWGDVINGGFGMLLDGSEEVDGRIRMMLNWDVANGVARRSWSGNQNAFDTIRRTMEAVPGLKITLPEVIKDNGILNNLFDDI
ncbi:urocanase rossmann-like domain-containing protein [Ditylenchus destructor]|nr:urocanase rossmann-like domain-containing protein [Ditylenchus destructor]